MKLRAYLVDDEPLALRRLSRLLEETGRVEIAGTNVDPVSAAEQIPADIDVLFLDIEMPELTGFQLLAKLNPQPVVVFTTAFDRYALKAFEVNSIDYLLKPIEVSQLDRALSKLERIRRGVEPRPELQKIVEELMKSIRGAETAYPERISSRVGERVQFLEVERITHFFAEDKLTYAASPEKNHVVDFTIAELEQKLDPRRFLRIHRSTLVRLDAIQEMLPWFGGRMLVRLKDAKKTELTVARDRVKILRERLAL